MRADDAITWDPDGEQSHQRRLSAQLQRGDQAVRDYWDDRQSESTLRRADEAYTQALEQAEDDQLNDVLLKLAQVALWLGDFPRAERLAINAWSEARPRASWILAQQRDAQGRSGDAFLLAFQAGPVAPVFRWARLVLRAAWRHGSWGSRILAMGLFVPLMLLGLLATPEAWGQWLGRASTWPHWLGYLWAQMWGNASATIRHLQAIRVARPGWRRPSELLIQHWLDQEHPEQALPVADQLLQRHPGDWQARVWKARVLQGLGLWASASQTLRPALSIRPEDPALHAMLGDCQSELDTDQAAEQAVNHYRLALAHERRPHQRSQLALAMGHLLSSRLDNPAAAIGYFQLALLSDPNAVAPRLELGVLLFQQKNYALAETIYRDGLRRPAVLRHGCDAARMASNLGYLCWVRGDLVEAMTFYKKAIGLDAHYAVPMNNLSVIYLDVLGDLGQAQELLEAATAMNPRYALAYYNLGRVYSQRGQTLRAAEAFHQAQLLNALTQELDEDDIQTRLRDLFDAA